MSLRKRYIDNVAKILIKTIDIILTICYNIIKEVKMERKKKADEKNKTDEKVKKMRIERSVLEQLEKASVISSSGEYTNADLDTLKAYRKLKRMGYEESSIMKILKSIGAPKEEDFELNPNYIKLNSLSIKISVPERTIKFYERQGLIPKPVIYKNKRYYQRSVMKDLKMIKALQQVGYKLNEINTALKKAVRPDSKGELARLKQELTEKRKVIDELIAILENGK